MSNTNTAKTISNGIKATPSPGSSMPPFVSVLISAASVLFSTVLPTALLSNDSSIMLSWLTCIAAGILFVFVTRKISYAVIFALICVLILPSIPSPIPIAVAIGTLALCGSYSALAASANRYQLLFLTVTPPAAYFVSLFLTADPAMSLLSIAAFPPALVLGLAIKAKMGRGFSIAAFAAVALLELCAAALTHIYLQNGAISLEIISNASEYLKNSIAWILKNAIVTARNVDLTEDLMIQASILAGETVNALVGIVTAAALIFGYIVQKLQHSFFECFELETLQNESGTDIKASLPSALVFSAAHILSFTSSSTHAPSFLATASLNISLVLLPLLVYVGFKALAALPRKIGFLAIAVWIGIAILATAMSYSLISIIALVGAFYIIFVNTDSWAKTHYSKGEDQ